MITQPWIAVPFVLLAHFAAATSYGAEQRYSVGDNRLRMTVTLQDSNAATIEYEANGRPFVGLRSSFGSIETDFGQLSIADGGNVAGSKTGDGVLVVSGKSREMNYSARCEGIAPGTVTVTVRLKPEKPLLIERGMLFDGRSQEKPAVAKTFRRKAPPTELRQWSVRAGSREEGLKANW